ncbi:MAG: hypothetical protein AAGJ82_09400, partial [Bacteroidota bacterium]
LLVFFVGWRVDAQPYSDSISINFFLLADCRISQNITGEINYVLDHYQRDNFHAKCYFPGKRTNAAEAEDFLVTYQLSLPYQVDYHHRKTRFYGATVAPQVVVYDEKQQRVLYSGRIDNSYAAVGSRRRIVSSRDLREALNAILSQQPISTPQTEAIGCYLNVNP